MMSQSAAPPINHEALGMGFGTAIVRSRAKKCQHETSARCTVLFSGVTMSKIYSEHGTNKTIPITAGAISETGLRSENQDCLAAFASPLGAVYLIADGMGAVIKVELKQPSW